NRFTPASGCVNRRTNLPLLRYHLSMLETVVLFTLAFQDPIAPHSAFEPPAARAAASLSASTKASPADLLTTGEKTDWRQTEPYPLGRNRRQGHRPHARPRHDDHQEVRLLARSRDFRHHPCVQCGWARALLAVQPAQPEWAAIHGSSRQRSAPESQSRLHQG